MGAFLEATKKQEAATAKQQLNQKPLYRQDFQDLIKKKGGWK